MRSAYGWIAVAAWTLAACGERQSAQLAPPPTPPPSVQQPVFDAGGPPAQAPAAAPADAPVTPQSLIGRWGDNGDCTKDIVFAADGSFRSYTGGSGTWTLNGENLTITGPNGAFPLRVRRIDDRSLMILNPDGTMGISQRC